mmetsp:Transcript_378/g.738  ORF Transcript_378/g.738 Transcript_378/m.738 type:complete len:560 (+) Transcript_378:460-2139(+)|eukprot:CAMPEP_0183711768 /NCGR_PEP_ID=MMETSP0737-20130205/7173_1 /TAXON_ID=385413 /ORGANISM="Thalassiosira miniscula, Strain CCMP1093" /LENGTH=559 /DNA_ID=CAMNT_0025940335 /DNA_START=335 /DNA_END=2014 /DNA_ORIENTATION=-
MILSFSSPKKKYQYTPHSAPVTNGILRNSKVTAGSNRPRNAKRCVTFSISRTSSQMSMDDIRELMAAAKVENPRRSKEKKQKKDSSKGNRRDQRSRSKGNDNDAVDVGYLYKPKAKTRPVGLPMDDDTIDTAEISNHSMEHQGPRRRLSLLVEAKIDIKLRRNSQESEDSNIKDFKQRRSSLLGSDESSITDELPPVYNPSNGKKSKLRRNTQGSDDSNIEDIKQLRSYRRGSDESSITDELPPVHKPFNGKKSKLRRNSQEDEDSNIKETKQLTSSRRGSEESSIIDDLPAVHKPFNGKKSKLRRNSQKSEDSNTEETKQLRSSRQGSEESITTDELFAEQKPSNGKNQRPRRRLSLLLDEKIETKLRRSSIESDQSSITDEENELNTPNQLPTGNVATSDDGKLEQAQASNGNAASIPKVKQLEALGKRTKLSLLLDEKIESKNEKNETEQRRSSLENEGSSVTGGDIDIPNHLPTENIATSDYGKLEQDQSSNDNGASIPKTKQLEALGKRTKLSLLLDEKIEAKTQRDSLMLTDDSIEDMLQLRWHNSVDLTITG